MVKLTRAIVKTTLIVMYITRQSLKLYCLVVIDTEAQNQPGDSSSCRKSMGARPVSYPLGAYYLWSCGFLNNFAILDRWVWQRLSRTAMMVIQLWVW